MVSDKKRLSHVATGLAMMMLAWALDVATLFTFIGMSILPALGYSTFVIKYIVPVMSFSFALLMTTSIISLAGQSFCLFAPSEVKGTQYTLASIFFVLVHTAVNLAQRFIYLSWLPHVGSVALYLSFVTQLFFLSRLASFLGRKDLQKLSVQSNTFGAISMVLLAFPILLGAAISLEIPLPVMLASALIISVSQLFALVLGALSFLRFMRATLGVRSAILEVK